MTLSTPVARRLLHTRTIVCHGFERDDGLIDIEASLIDAKAYAHRERVRGDRQAGSHTHEMWVRLTINAVRVVQDIEVAMPSAPYAMCQSVKPNFSRLIGVKIGGGWRKDVNDAVGAREGCTHIREPLFPMATVAFQTLGGARPVGQVVPSRELELRGRPFFIDGCMSWASDGELVADFYPQFSIRGARAAKTP